MGSRDRAVGSVDRRPRGGRAARRRQGTLRRKGRAGRRREREHRDRRGGRRASTRSTSRASTACWSSSTGRRTRVGSAPMRCSASRWPPPTPQPRPRASRCIGTWVATSAHVLPVPLVNILNGGKHAGRLDRFPGVHDRAARARRPSPRRCAGRPRRSTRSATLLHERGFATTVGDEGGYAPSLRDERSGHRARARGDPARGLSARRADRDRARPRRDRGVRGGAIRPDPRAAHALRATS